MKVLKASVGEPWRAWDYERRVMTYLVPGEGLAPYGRPDVVLMRHVVPGVWVGDIVMLDKRLPAYVVRNDGLLEDPDGGLVNPILNVDELVVVGNIFESGELIADCQRADQLLSAK